MSAAKWLRGCIAFFCLGSCLATVPAGPLSVRLLSDSACAQLVPGKPTCAPSPRLIPHVRYQEEIVLENGDRAVKLRFYSEEDPANPPVWFRAWENGRPVPPVRGTAPEELIRLAKRNGNPMHHAWILPAGFEARETKRIRIEAEYPVLPVSDRPGYDRFETYFSFWGWRPSRPALLFRLDLAPMIAAIPCLGRPLTPALASWLFSSWFAIRPAGYESRGFTLQWRFEESAAPEGCERICVEWPAWYR